MFTYCQVEIPQGETTITTALFFSRAQCIKMLNVAVMNTNGYGIVVRSSTKLSISNCTFANNSRGNIQIMLDGKGKGKINITRTNFYKGNGRRSGGLYIIVSSGVSSSISITHCEFIANRDVSGSHMQISSRSDKKSSNSNRTVKIENSTFLSGEDSPGIMIDSNDSGRGKLFVIFRNSSFSNNKFGAFNITTNLRMKHYTVTLVIERCNFTGSHGIDDDCSVLEASEAFDLTLRDVRITDNNCIGIKLSASRIKFENIIKKPWMIRRSNITERNILVLL